MNTVRRLWGVLEPNQRKRVPGLLGGMTVVAVLELAGVGGFLPLVALLTDPEAALAHPWMRTAFEWSGAADVPGFIVRLGALMLVLLLLKAALTAWSNYRTFRFGYDVQISASLRMLAGLLSQDYEYFLGSNSAILLKNVTAETLTFTGGVLLPMLQATSQVLILVMVTSAVAFVSPVVALCAALAIGGLSIVLYFGIHRRLALWGQVRDSRLSELSRLAHQAFSLIKALKTMGGEERYLSEFQSHGALYAQSNTRYQTASVAPTLLIELVVFGGVIAVLMQYAITGRDVTRLVPLVTLFGAAAYRVLPAARAVFAHVVTIRFNLVTLRTLEEGMRGPVSLGTAASTSAPPVNELPRVAREIALENVSYGYPGTDMLALNGISLEIPVGSSVAFVGTSGAGKTTLVDILMGLLEPSGGSVRIDTRALERWNRRSWQSQLGYVPQQAFLADGTLRENIAFGVHAADIDDDAVMDAARRASLAPLLERLRSGLDTALGENGVRLSGGERQRVAIARALYRRPSVLVLDEATSALDSVTEREINEELVQSARGVTLVIVAHRLSTVRACDRLVLLRGGQIVASGTYDHLIQTSAEFAAMARHPITSPAAHYPALL